jgi:hypothetical protein
VGRGVQGTSDVTLITDITASFVSNQFGTLWGAAQCHYPDGAPDRIPDGRFEAGKKIRIAAFP